MPWEDVPYAVEPLDDPHITEFLTAFRQVYVNGGVVLRSFRATNGAAFDHALRNHFRGIDYPSQRRTLEERMTKTNPKVILDKSFLQAESRSCRRLRALRLCGCTFVLTDTLIYELCTGNRDTLWTEAQRKLWEFADAIEVWRHTGELLRKEVAMQAPVRSPFDGELTARTKYWFQRRTEQAPDDLRAIADAARQQREMDSIEALIADCRALCRRISGSYEQIRRNLGQGKDLGNQMDDLVNQQRMIDYWVKKDHGNPLDAEVYINGAEVGLGPEWFAYHHARSSLALWCVFMLKYGEKDTPGKEFRNTKLDADYAALLHYADALATNETSGSMADMCSWLYLRSKKLFSTSSLDAVLPCERDIRLPAYARWERRERAHGNDLDDWLSAERELALQAWDRLGVERVQSL